MAYYEGEINSIGYGNNGGWGNEAWWIVILLALGWGNGGFGNGFGGRGAGSEMLGYELGKVATTNDVASGFSTSAIMSNQRDTQLAMQQGFSDVQQTLCRGFSDINLINERGFATTNYNMAQNFHGVDNSICTLGFQVQQGFNGLNTAIDKCCCDVKQMLLENRYLNEKQTCDIVQAINNGNQRLVDIYTNDKIDTLNRKLAVAEGQISQNAQTCAIVNALSPKQPIPAYPVFPATSFAHPTGVTFGIGNNCGCGCGCNNNGF